MQKPLRLAVFASESRKVAWFEIFASPGREALIRRHFGPGLGGAFTVSTKPRTLALSRAGCSAGGDANPAQAIRIAILEFLEYIDAAGNPERGAKTLRKIAADQCGGRHDLPEAQTDAQLLDR